MIIKRFILPSSEDEISFIYSGGTTIGMPCNSTSILPFGYFPKHKIDGIEFGDITVFTGSRRSPRDLLVKIIVSKYIEKCLPVGMNKRCLGEYINRCYGIFADFACRDKYKFEYISSEYAQCFVDERYAKIDQNIKWSALDIYASKITKDAFVIIESPEQYLSLDELCELAEYMDGCIESAGCQFLVSSNSPIIIGMRKAIIYDFDEDVPTPDTWCRSHIAARYTKRFEDIANTHKYKKQTK